MSWLGRKTSKPTSAERISAALASWEGAPEKYRKLYGRLDEVANKVRPRATIRFNPHGLGVVEFFDLNDGGVMIQFWIEGPESAPSCFVYTQREGLDLIKTFFQDEEMFPARVTFRGA